MQLREVKLRYNALKRENLNIRHQNMKLKDTIQLLKEMNVNY